MAVLCRQPRGAHVHLSLGAIAYEYPILSCLAYWCRYSAGDQAHILFSVEIKDAAELSRLMQRLNDRQMPTQDLSGIEAAQVGSGWCCNAGSGMELGCLFYPVFDLQGKTWESENLKRKNKQ